MDGNSTSSSQRSKFICWRNSFIWYVGMLLSSVYIEEKPMYGLEGYSCIVKGSS